MVLGEGVENLSFDLESPFVFIVLIFKVPPGASPDFLNPFL
jgi:hypothetical protein